MSDHATVLFEFSRPRMPARAWRRAVRHLALMVEVWRTRRILATMDPRMLKDIGLSRSDALNEIGRAPWDIEPHL